MLCSWQLCLNKKSHVIAHNDKYVSTTNNVTAHDHRYVSTTTDHLITTLSWHQLKYMQCRIRKCRSRHQLPKRSVWIYKQAERSLARKLLSRLFFASPTNDIDVFWRQWSTTFLEAMKLWILHKSVTTKISTPWIDCHIQQEISRRERCLNALPTRTG